MRKTNIIILIILIIFQNQCSQEQKSQPGKSNQSDTMTTKPITPDSIPANTKKQPDTLIQEPPPKKQQEIISETASSKANISSADLWQKYQQYREESKTAFNNSEFQKAVQKLKQTAQYARQLNRDDLAAWQYNNIGYYSILEFKGETNYDYRMHQLRTIDREAKRRQFANETKELFREHLKLLTDAETYLEKAYELDKKYNNKSRTEKIYSNLQFIDWVKNYINS